MAKRIILISSGPLFIVLAVIAIVFVGIGQGQPASIESARTQIITLADEGKLTEIDTAIDKLITDYAGNSELPVNLLIIADSFAWRRLNDKADRLYRHILDNETDTALTTKARLGLSRLDILNLIAQKKISAAKEQANFLVSDFRNEPDSAVALFQIGQEFGWQRRYEESKNAFDGIISTFPKTALAQEVKLWSARANICEMIGKDKVKDDEIVAAIDKLISDFEGDSRLTDTLFWIGREYEWSKGHLDDVRTNWYDAPNSVYERLMSKFKYGQAEWDYKRLSHRMKIFNLLKGTDQNAVETAIKEMATELAGIPELAGELYWIACGYEEQEKSVLAKEMYEQIIAEFSDSAEQDKATLDVRRLDIWEAIKAGDIDKTQKLTDALISDFNQHPYSGTCLGRVSIKCYFTAIRVKKHNWSQAQDYFAKAEEIWQKIIEKLPNNLAETYYYIGCSRQQQSKWDDAIESFQKVINDYPEFEDAGVAQAAVGWCYEALRDSNQVPKEAINPIIEEAYTTVLEKYPDCYVSDYAAYKLAGMMLEKGEKDNAIAYYRKFLELTNPRNGLISSVKKTLENLEGTSK